MTMLLRIPFKAAGLAAGAAGSTLRLAGAAAGVALERLVGGRTARPPGPAPAPGPATPPPAHRPRRHSGNGAAAEPPARPSAPPPPAAPAGGPTRADAARLRKASRERERGQTDEGPGAEVHVSEPWPGYAQLRAADVVDRLAAADEAEKAVVLLYERAHRARKTVIAAASKP
jgi:hypothetical protein